jgi:hypothetical protein
MSDISDLSIQESTVLHLTHPANGEKLYIDRNDKFTLEKTDKPVTITVLSTSSREYRIAVNAMHNRRLKRGKKQETAEQQKEEGVELLVAVCAGSENLKYKGNAVRDDADFRALLSDDKMSWIKSQVDETLGSVELFIA